MNLAAMINNFNNKCHYLYKFISKYLGGGLYKTLKEIELFYYSDFWVNRLKKKCKEHDIYLNDVMVDVILGTVSDVIDTTKFKFVDKDKNMHGSSNETNIVTLNRNMHKIDLNDQYINNVIMHELGHRMYNETYFKDIIKINSILLRDAHKYITKDLSDEDIKYFTNADEMRLRLFPIVKEMYENKWTVDKAYENSKSLRTDSLFEIFDKDYITYLLNNII